MSHADPECVAVPPFKRLNYHYGQMLGARDFQTEQDFFRHKMLLQNRCLHGYGVVCGLLVIPAPAGNPDAQEPEKCPTRVAISCGLGLDIHGHELVVRDTLCVDLWKELPDDEKKEFEAARGRDQECPLYILLCFNEVPVDKQPVELTENCLASNTYTYAKVCESVCVRVTIRKPPRPEDEPCDPCCTPYDDACLWLARIDSFQPYQPVQQEQIHNEIRRPLSTYRPTVITGVNWVHGADYTEDDAEARLNSGLSIRFSRPVRTNSLRDGIVDVWVTDDWTGPSSGSFRSLSVSFGPWPDVAYTDTLNVQVRSRGLKCDERVLIIVRTDFIIDRCCQPVDGNHIGGWVPLLEGVDVPEYIRSQQVDPASYNCPQLPGRVGPWTSGNGTPGGAFESWIFVRDIDQSKYKAGKKAT